MSSWRNQEGTEILAGATRSRTVVTDGTRTAREIGAAKRACHRGPQKVRPEEEAGAGGPRSKTLGRKEEEKRGLERIRNHRRNVPPTMTVKGRESRSEQREVPGRVADRKMYLTTRAMARRANRLAQNGRVGRCRTRCNAAADHVARGGTRRLARCDWRCRRIEWLPRK